MESISQHLGCARQVRGHPARTALWMMLALAMLSLPARAQRSSDSRSSSSQNSGTQKSGTPSSDSQAPDSAPAPARSAIPPKAPALVDPDGPDVSLQSSEALFYIAAALNSCGYDQGLAASDPLRMQIRAEVNQALVESADARDAHDQVCTFIAQHRLSNPGLDLAQYISLALYTTAPPNLTPSAQDVDMPPDSTQVVGILPMLRKFSELIDLHLIWLRNRAWYEGELNQLHDSLSRMIVETNAYLRLPVGSTESGRRFLVVIEPQLDPGQTDARVYGTDYVVVVSPVNAVVRMNEVRHTYLHYVIEPLLYDQTTSLTRFQPFLKIIRDAPIDDADRTDIVALTVECIIRAIEARTMDTGVAIYKVPDGVRRAEVEDATRLHNASVEQAAAVRRAAVERAVTQGYVLTSYFYSRFAIFEKQPQSFKESIGEMVYGMDMASELNYAKHVTFAPQADPEVVRKAPRPAAGLDVAEEKLAQGDADGAEALAEQVLEDKSGDPARANFILARAAILDRDVPSAQKDFAETIRLSKDPRMLAWSHIYLGRLYDVQDDRDHAMTEYQAALVVRDGQPDTKQAAEEGLKRPYAVPQRTPADGADGDRNAPDGLQPSPSPTGGQPHAADSPK
jgi:hypothetical protein